MGILDKSFSCEANVTYLEMFFFENQTVFERKRFKVTRSFAYLLIKVPLDFVWSNLNTSGSA